tara:strand:+ start:258 stop:380 length:123 start_codon:yes stop_codon:yes gene_type:complete
MMNEMLNIAIAGCTATFLIVMAKAEAPKANQSLSYSVVYM